MSCSYGYYGVNPISLEAMLNVVNRFIIVDNNGTLSVVLEDAILEKASENFFGNNSLEDYLSDDSLRCFEIPEKEIDEFENYKMIGNIGKAETKAIPIYFSLENYNEYSLLDDEDFEKE